MQTADPLVVIGRVAEGGHANLNRAEGANALNLRMVPGVKRLAESISTSPALVIPRTTGRPENIGHSGLFDSVVVGLRHRLRDVIVIRSSTWSIGIRR